MATCENCGKEFNRGNSRTKRFCSPECRLEGMAKARADKKKQCKYCGKRFKGAGIYCNPEHKRISEGIKNGSKKLYLQIWGEGK